MTTAPRQSVRFVSDLQLLTICSVGSCSLRRPLAVKVICAAEHHILRHETAFQPFREIAMERPLGFGAEKGRSRTLAPSRQGTTFEHDGSVQLDVSAPCELA
jgi:hypothetical protein